MSATKLPAELTPGTELTTVALAKVLARGGGGCASHRATINRWCGRGVAVAGRRVKLAAVRRGGKWVTTWGAFCAFQAACTAAAGGAGAEVLAETPAARRRRAAAAGKELDKLFTEILG